jgi:hypothetical protein
MLPYLHVIELVLNSSWYDILKVTLCSKAKSPTGFNAGGRSNSSGQRH